MQDDAIALLAEAGVRLSAAALASRKLALEDESGNYRFIFVKPADVLFMLSMELLTAELLDAMCYSNLRDVLLPLDLGIARCRMVVAAIDPK